MDQNMTKRNESVIYTALASMRLISLLLIAVLLSACNNDYFFFEMKEMDAQGWDMDDPAVFSFETQDTSSYLDFYLDIRNNESYPYRNIYSFIDMSFPNGKHLRDTIHYPNLASPEGKWSGQATGSSYDNSIMYKRRRKLPLPGDYQIKVTHAMRDSLLVGIDRVGIHISTGEPK